jgi:hypothetical protein
VTPISGLITREPRSPERGRRVFLQNRSAPLAAGVLRNAMRGNVPRAEIRNLSRRRLNVDQYALARLLSTGPLTFQAARLYPALSAGANERFGWRTGPYVLRTKKTPRGLSHAGALRESTMLRKHTMCLASCLGQFKVG